MTRTAAGANGAFFAQPLSVIKRPTLPFVFVLWDDAWKSSTDDTKLENADDDHKPEVAIASGFVLRDNEKGIQLANEWSPNGTWRQRAFIPRQLIVQVQPVRLTLVRSTYDDKHDAPRPSRRRRPQPVAPDAAPRPDHALGAVCD